MDNFTSDNFTSDNFTIDNFSIDNVTMGNDNGSLSEAAKSQNGLGSQSINMNNAALSTTGLVLNCLAMVAVLRTKEFTRRLKVPVACLML